MSFPRTVGKTVSKSRTALIVSLIITIVTIGTAVALLSLQQTVPSETFSGPVAVTSSTCNSATTPLTNLPNPAPLTAGVVNMTCATGPSHAAFTVTTAGSDTPTFALPTVTGVTEGLYIISPQIGCSGPAVPATGQVLTSGTQTTLSLGSYDYCWTYTAIPTGGAVATSFTITWTS